ncbi:unnamed protein product [Brachionus calyciflorus]|uniref:Chitin-binding type-2 domain-containing protein n=1 Tax=Brachionus calyciflorus TaxID=104777 RepID=A0A813MMV9_9BILA|nr:unnamed protein product [Brachionus calyciflorus]
MNSAYFFIAFIVFHQVFSMNWLGQYANHCDFYGNDLVSKILNNTDQCRIYCFINQKCNHYTFRFMDNTCFLKSKNDITHGEVILKYEHNCGIIDRTKLCFEMIDNPPVPLSCNSYYNCIKGHYNFASCDENKLFDPFKRECGSHSECYHGCRNSTDKVGIPLKTNQFYDCQTNLTHSCSEGLSFDLKEKKCLKPALKNMFEFKKTDNFSNVLLAKRKVFDERLCLNWCNRVFYCKIVQYENNICKIFGESSNNSQYLNYNNVYFLRNKILVEV